MLARREDDDRVVRALADAALIDEYHVFVHPVVAGSGKRPFREGDRVIGLRLIGTKTFSGGVVALTYERGFV
jgi:dihydrofolate reductase